VGAPEFQLLVRRCLAVARIEILTESAF
jgi:hypothetical protein